MAKRSVVLGALSALGLVACGGGDTSSRTQRPERPLLDRDATLVAVGATRGEPGRLQFEVPIEAGDHLEVSVRSSAFDPVLEVKLPDQFPVSNDDWNGDRTQSRVTVHATHAGTMLVTVSSVVPEAAGACHVTVRRVANTRRDPALARSPIVQPGQPFQGEIRTGDSALPDGRLYDQLVVMGPEQGSLDIRLTARGPVVPLAIVLAPDGDAIAASANGAYTLTEPGPHRVQLVAALGAAAAPYTLEVRPGDAGSTPTLAREHHQLPTNLPTRPLPGAGVEAALSAASSRLPTGEAADVYALDGHAGDAITIDMLSEAFDAYLLLVGPNGRHWENDDAGGSPNSSLSVTLPETGSYRIVATAYRPGMEGPYQLKVGTGRAAPDAPDVAGTQAPPAGLVATGASLEGALERGDETLRTGELVDTYRRSFTPGQAVQIRLSSSDFDPYLIVMPPRGDQMDNDDYAAPDRAAGIDIPAALPGEYRILVTSYEKGETGRYRVSFGDGPAVARPSDVSPRVDADPGARPSGPTGSRIFGLFAGISDYPAGVGDLDECANDAVKLAEALRRTGLLAEENQTVLTDARATTGAIRQAMQRIAHQAGPEDVVIFFWSGHGGQRTGSHDVREIDATDETLVLYDGEIVDDELGRMFDALNARVSILALDSCFAGGFAKDVITRPGRVGFFSSEEDVESSVASQFQAGGYLSYFMRTGVAGSADTSPHDGVLTVGELEHFLYGQFGRHASDVELEGAFQHLVVDRGAVRSSQVLWSYR